MKIRHALLLATRYSLLATALASASAQTLIDNARLGGATNQIKSGATLTAVSGATVTFASGSTFNIADGLLAIADTSGLQAALDAKLAITTAANTYQPLDSDLTSIAALTTASFGRSLLTTANEAALAATMPGHLGSLAVATTPVGSGINTYPYFDGVGSNSTVFLTLSGYRTQLGLVATALSTDAAGLTGTLASARIADASLSIAKTSGLQAALDAKATTVALTAESNRALDAEVALGDSISTLNVSLNDEIAARIAVDAAKADKTTTVTAAGLATGGGTLAANRTITVTKSTSAQVITGTDDATAVTPLGNKAALDAGVARTLEGAGLRFNATAGATITSGVIGTGDFLVSFFASPKIEGAAVAPQPVISGPDGAGNLYVIFTSESFTTFDVGQGTVGAITSTAVPFGPAFYVIYRASGVIYVERNGIQIASAASTVNFTTAFTAIGIYPGIGWTFSGTISRMAVGNFAPSVAERAALFANLGIVPRSWWASLLYIQPDADKGAGHILRAPIGSDTILPGDGHQTGGVVRGNPAQAPYTLKISISGTGDRLVGGVDSRRIPTGWKITDIATDLTVSAAITFGTTSGAVDVVASVTPGTGYRQLTMAQPLPDPSRLWVSGTVTGSAFITISPSN